MSESPNPAIESARRLLGAERHGVLCTLSQALPGCPFGSVGSYALTSRGEPLLLISEIAEHTHNLRAASRMSLFIADSAAREDPQAGARLTLMGRAEPVPDEETADARRRYLARFPKAEAYFQAHDFTLFRVLVERARYIGGFGQIYWLSPNALLAPGDTADPLASHVVPICEHMNQDHGDALQLLCRALGGVEFKAPRMTHVDAGGFEIADGGIRGGIQRINFQQPVSTPEEVRQAMIRLIRDAREHQRVR